MLCVGVERFARTFVNKTAISSLTSGGGQLGGRRRSLKVHQSDDKREKKDEAAWDEMMVEIENGDKS